MRRKWLILLGCVSGALQAFAQKSVLDTSVLYQWPSVEEKGILSPDGKYAGYVVYDNFTRQRRPTYFIKATSSSWEKQLPDVEKVDFTADSRKAVYLDSAMLHILSLGTAEVERIPHISTYQLIKMNGEGYLLYYSETERRLSVRGKSMLESYSDVDRWLLSTDGRVLLKITKQREDRQLVTRIELETKDEKIIWDGRPVKDCMMDDGGRQAVFTVTDQSGQDYICYYKAGEEKARPIVDAGNSLIDKTISVGKLLKFSKDGDRLFFNLKEPRSLRRESKLVSVDVWSYRDPKLQSQQLQEDAPQKERNYLAVVDLNGKFTVLRLQLEAEGPGKFSPDGNYVVFDEARGERSEQGWSAAAQYKYDLVDSRSGKRKEIGRFHLIDFSPAGRFLDLIHPETHETYTYEIATGVIRPLTSTAPLTHKAPNGEGRNLTTFHGLMSVTGWLPGDHTVLVQDYYDLWELDPLGKRAPLCLTHRQGVKTKTTFAIAMDERRGVIMDDTLLLSAFDHNTKDNGFYRIVLHKEQVPGKLTMGPYFYSMRFSSLPWQQPVKAENAEIYLLRRQSISESPNYFVTGDFRTFNPVSALYPEKKYNWTRSRLIAFKTTDGRDEQGVLYMPEDFDPGKKYPLIFHYYEVLSDFLNFYQNTVNRGAGGGMSDLNIAWFTSHGYLVFTPDFHYKMGKAGEYVVQTAKGAVQLLKTLPYVDGKHLGLQGHSFGGWETNYLVTHTNEFAAAVSSAGPTDWVSSYGDTMPDGSSRQNFIENTQGMWPSLWEHPDYFIPNSPLFYADKVTTPLMMVANKRDHNVQFTQGLEFFTALRRLGKKAWMLQYDREGHGEGDQPECLDYLLRSTQFFDHYLKGAPAAKWMVEGIPAAMKQIDDGLELEPADVEPGPGLLTPEAQKAVEALKSKKPITVSLN